MFELKFSFCKQSLIEWKNVMHAKKKSFLINVFKKEKFQMRKSLFGKEVEIYNNRKKKERKKYYRTSKATSLIRFFLKASFLLTREFIKEHVTKKSSAAFFLDLFSVVKIKINVFLFFKNGNIF